MRKVLLKKGNLFMSEKIDCDNLLANIQKTRTLLDKIIETYDEFLENDLKLLGKKQTTAMVVAEVLVDYYTCLETLFFRISQFFENGLEAKRWHADLLDKMQLEVPGIRNAFIDESLKRDLLELMRFRHFRRYYFELNHDWDKLDFMTKKLKNIHGALPQRFDDYQGFLISIKEELEK